MLSPGDQKYEHRVHSKVESVHDLNCNFGIQLIFKTTYIKIKLQKSAIFFKNETFKKSKAVKFVFDESWSFTYFMFLNKNHFLKDVWLIF